MRTFKLFNAIWDSLPFLESVHESFGYQGILFHQMFDFPKVANRELDFQKVANQALDFPKVANQAIG